MYRFISICIKIGHDRPKQSAIDKGKKNFEFFCTVNRCSNRHSIVLPAIQSIDSVVTSGNIVQRSASSEDFCFARVQWVVAILTFLKACAHVYLHKINLEVAIRQLFLPLYSNESISISCLCSVTKLIEKPIYQCRNLVTCWRVLR